MILSQHLTQQWRQCGAYDGRSLGQVVDDGLARFGGVALRFWSSSGTAETTVGALADGVRRAANGLRLLGLSPGDAVIVQAPAGIDGLQAQWACMLAGLVLVPVVPIYGVAELAHIIVDSGARAALVPARWKEVDLIRRIKEADRGGQVEFVITIGDHAHDGVVDWERLHASQPASALPPLDADAVNLIVYTSGSTGVAKGVRHSGNTIGAELRVTGRAVGRTADTVLLNPNPPGHMAGVLSCLRPLHLGAAGVFMERWDPSAAVELIRSYGVNALSAGAPLILQDLLAVGEQSASGREALRHLTDVAVGGAMVSEELVRIAHDSGVVVYRQYGSSEQPSVTSGLPREPLDVRARNDGPPVLPNRVRVLDEEGNDVSVGVPGEIVCVGPEQFLGYTREEFTSEAFTPDGWLRTGDVGVLDREGRLTVIDRIKDLINRGGEKISAREVEILLVQHPAILDAAAVAVPDERYGEKVCAVVVLTAGAQLDLNEVRAFFAEKGVARQKVPERLETVRALPRTAGGKVQRDALRSRFGTRRATDGISSNRGTTHGP